MDVSASDERAPLGRVVTRRRRPTRRLAEALRWSCGCEGEGSARGMPSVTLSRCSLLLDDLPVGDDGLGRVGHHVAEHVGVAADQLVVHAPGHVGQGEAALLAGQRGMEDHLEEHVAELLFEVGDGHSSSPSPASARVSSSMASMAS